MSCGAARLDRQRGPVLRDLASLRRWRHPPAAERIEHGAAFPAADRLHVADARAVAPPVAVLPFADGATPRSAAPSSNGSAASMRASSSCRRRDLLPAAGADRLPDRLLPDCVVEETGEPDLRALLRQRFAWHGVEPHAAKYPASTASRNRRAGRGASTGRPRATAWRGGIPRPRRGTDSAAREDTLVRWLMACGRATENSTAGATCAASRS